MIDEIIEIAKHREEHNLGSRVTYGFSTALEFNELLEGGLTDEQAIDYLRDKYGVEEGKKYPIMKV